MIFTHLAKIFRNFSYPYPRLGSLENLKREEGIREIKLKVNYLTKKFISDFDKSLREYTKH